MTKINNYEELVAERIRLQNELQKQKSFFKAEINEVKTKLEPIGDVISFLGIFRGKNTASRPSLLKTGVSMGIDLLVRDKLSKANWVIRALIPAVLKGISNQIIKKKMPSAIPSTKMVE
jgi:hypothetical protein